MALIWADGFDHYGNTANLRAQRYGGGCAISADARTGNGALTFQAADNTYSFPALGAWVLGFGLKLNNYGGHFMMQGNSVYNGCSLVINNDGSVSAFKGRPGEGGAVRATSAPNVIQVNAYYYVEIGIDLAMQRFRVRINNVLVIDFTGDIWNGGPLSSNQWCWRTGGVVDDFYVCDTTGDLNTDFLGDIRCRTLLPDGAGAAADWTANTAGAQPFEEIDNVPFDPNKFIKAGEVGDLSDFTFTGVPSTTAFSYGMVAHWRASKSDAGSCEITPSIISGGVGTEGTPVAPGLQSAQNTTVFERDPNGSAYWTRAAVNDIRMGVERTA